MARIEKTVFISYRRTDVYTALAVYENLKNQGYDVFFDYTSISSGDFEQIITANIKARAHFILILTPTALDRCNEPGDWLRREIEIAIDEKRNIVPLFFKEFRFGTPSVSEKLTGKLKHLSRYNGLNVHEDYFQEAMQRLRIQFLNKPLDTVLHPVSTEVRKAVEKEQVAADKALEQFPDVKELVKQAKANSDQLAVEPLSEILEEAFSTAGIPSQSEENITERSVSLEFSANLEEKSKELEEPVVKRKQKRQFERHTDTRWLNRKAIDHALLGISNQIKRILGKLKFRTVGIVVAVLFLIFEGFNLISSGMVEILLNLPTPPTPVASQVWSRDGMTLVYIPAGKFIMGSDNVSSVNVKPSHEVYIDAFWIDQTEVTFAMYAKCVQDGVCNPASSPSSGQGVQNTQFDNFPVTLVSWNDANTYCEWSGRRLPTEAEWEKAARGTDGRLYPWGNNRPKLNTNLLNYNKNDFPGTSEVGKYPNGASPYGVMDTTANASEWVADWYDEAYYQNSPASNPLGPSSGTEHVIRGHPGNPTIDAMTSFYRQGAPSNIKDYDLGFRCALSESESPVHPPVIGETIKSPKDNSTLLYVPAGEFTMGSDADSRLKECQKWLTNCQRSWFEDEDPPHSVYLDAFWIDRTEVTNKMYQLCVDAGVCKEPTSKVSATRSSYYDNPEFENYPVLYVDWNMAKAYCEWSGRRLPTEAEWEKSARGNDKRTYPWGNEEPNDKLLNFGNYKNDGDTTEVGKHPSGASPFGLMDTSGNVWEWVADWYSNSYYTSSPTSNPRGPDSGQYHVLRGGAWDSNDWEGNIHSSNRDGDFPTSSKNNTGFRCAISESERATLPLFVQSSKGISQPTTTALAPEKTTPPLSPTSIPTIETVIAPLSNLDIGSTMTGKDGMTLFYVPAGEFTMGSNADYDEKPIHKVNLDSFWIDRTEITNAMYSKCVDSGKCNPPGSNSSVSRIDYYNSSEFDNFPVIYVNWNMAKTYCEWVGRRLPTEAEWEKAARGSDERVYPWGNAAPTTFRGNWNSNIGDTIAVGTFGAGISPYGALDMAGNVWEWVADWFSYTYYTSSPISNPLGPAEGAKDIGGSPLRVIRGGSWRQEVVSTIRTTVRSGDDPMTQLNELGFRCAMSATP